MRKHVLLIVSVFMVAHVFAQQDAHYSMYRFNGLYLNPAYTGSRDNFSFTGLYRTQWISIPGAPQSASVAAHSPFKQNRVALGAIYTYDKIGVTSTNTVNASFAYRIPIGKRKDVKLCLGVSAGFQNYQSDLNSVTTTDPGDPAFAGNSQNRWLPDAGFGIYFYSPRFFAGASVLHLLTNALTGKADVFATSTAISRQYYTMNINGGYVIDVSKKVKFIPSMLIKYTPAHAPLSFDFNASFIFIDRINVGVAYRLNDSYNFMMAANVTKFLRIGYCYDLSVSALSRSTSGSHEVMFGLDFATPKGKLANPARISWF